MTSSAPAPYRLFVGIDLAAKTFTATWTADRLQYVPSMTFDYTATGMADFQAHVQTTAIAPAQPWLWSKPPAAIGSRWR